MSSNTRRSVPRNLLVTLGKGWIVLVGSAVIFGLGGLVYSLLLTPKYEASTTLFITSGGTITPSAYDTVKASQERVGSYAQLIYSDAVIRPAIEQSGLNWSLDQARKSIGVDINPQVVLMTIQVQDASPEAAQKFATSLADSMTKAVSTLEVPGSGYEPTAKLSVVSPAEVSPDPVSPNTRANVAMATLLGLFVGVVIVIIRDLTHRYVRNADDTEGALGAPVLADLPGGPKDTPPVLAGFVDPRSEANAATTSLRKLRSELAVQLHGADHPKVLVVGTGAAGGQTALTANLAAVLAQSGTSAVVVDANYAGKGQPQLVNLVGAQEGLGLTDVLRGDAALADVVQRNVGGRAGFAVLGAGAKSVEHPDDVADVFASGRFAQVLADLALEFEYVLVCAPALTGESWVRTLVPDVDGVVAVVHAGSTRMSELSDLNKQVSAGKGRVLGSVVVDSGKAESESEAERIKVSE
jgi:polysaccharide biosynthesis transport protein